MRAQELCAGALPYSKQTPQFRHSLLYHFEILLKIQQLAAVETTSAGYRV